MNVSGMRKSLPIVESISHTSVTDCEKETGCQLGARACAQMASGSVDASVGTAFVVTTRDVYRV